MASEIMVCAREACSDGRIGRDALELVDLSVARFWRRRGPHAPFLDTGARVHRSVLDLALHDHAGARRHLEAALAAGHEHRADLWGHLGDACLATQRNHEACACYVRALLLYLDRSRGRADLLQREEMAGPAGELFARYMAACRGREQTARCSGGGGAAGEA
jgi:hypothetical protein